MADETLVFTQDTTQFSLLGRISSPVFHQWMAKQAAKLGVAFDSTELSAERIDVTASGAPEMLEAFALACSLGPESVLVDELVWQND